MLLTVEKTVIGGQGVILATAIVLVLVLVLVLVFSGTPKVQVRLFPAL
jgi:hypothetical protein